MVDPVMADAGDGRGLSQSGSRRMAQGGNAVRGSWGLRGMMDNPLERASASRRQDAMDDEEALKWAAVERLPTYDRVRTSVFHDVSTGSVKQVDVRQLTPLETNELLNKLMAEAQDENNVFLQKMRKRLDKYTSLLPHPFLPSPNIQKQNVSRNCKHSMNLFSNNFVRMFSCWSWRKFIRKLSQVGQVFC